MHNAGGLLYYDGANLNAILGKVRPGDMDFDVIHAHNAVPAADAVLQFAMTTSAVKGTSKASDRAVTRVKAASLPYRGGHLQK